MKKSIILLHIFTFIPYIFGMELKSIPQHFPDDLKEKILLALAFNVHHYIDKEKGSDQKAVLASEIINNIRLLNKNLYNKINNTSPNLIRTILINTAYNKSYGTSYFQKPQAFTFPGAKKYFELSWQLYDENLTPQQLEQLFNEGAILNYRSDGYHHPLNYWCCITRKNKQQAAIITTLLKLDAKSFTNIDDNLSYVINNKNIEYTKIIAPYAPKTHHCWDRAFSSGPEYIDILIKHSQQKDLNEGLKTCVETKLYQREKSIDYEPEAMQKLIDAGADTSIALNHLIQELPKITTPTNSNANFYRNLTLLLQHKAFSSEALDKLIKIKNIFDCLKTTIEKNQPKKNKDNS